MSSEKPRCVVCGAKKTDRCHIKSRGSGGGDEDWNILHMCRGHHLEQHTYGFREMTERYPILKKELRERGWEFTPWGKLVRNKGYE